MSAHTYDIIKWSALGLLVVAWVYAVATGLRGDPSLGRRRCRRCWHDMGGLEPDPDEGWTCPECGAGARTERLLLRRRVYRKRLVAAALALGVPPSVWYGEVVEGRWGAEGPAALVPTWLAVRLSPDHIDDETDGHALDRLMLRTILRRMHTTDRDEGNMVRAPEIPIEDTPLIDAIILPGVAIEGEPVVYGARSLARSSGALYELVRLRTNAGGMLPVDVPTKWVRPNPGLGPTTFGPTTLGAPNTVPAIGPERFKGGEARVDVVYMMQRKIPFHFYDRRVESVLIDVPMFGSRESALRAAIDTGVINPVMCARQDGELLARPWLSFLQLDGRFGLDWSREAFRPPHASMPADDFVLEVQIRDGDEVLASALRNRSRRLLYEHHKERSPSLGVGVSRRIMGGSRAELLENLERMRLRTVPRPDLALGASEGDAFWVPADGWYIEQPLIDALSKDALTGPTLDLLGDGEDAAHAR
ncbi:MAG: hypothetical protein AAGH64_00160 [Planctomycetota bacterium]